MDHLLRSKHNISPLISLLLLIVANSASAFTLNTTTYGQGYAPLFSEFNIIRSTDDTSVSLLLNRYSGSGFISSSYYNYGLFSASIKLPSNYSAGIVVAFYTSNGDVFEKTHDELDFEFLGNVRGKPWRFQTNLYGNGSTHRGREERYTLWFDPAKEFHQYTILWTSKQIISFSFPRDKNINFTLTSSIYLQTISRCPFNSGMHILRFYIDEIPIRQVIRNDAMGSDYPSKPMSLYATIWDASKWATNGGKYSVNYRYQPFVSEFKDLVLQGCTVNPIQQLPAPQCDSTTTSLESADFNIITLSRRDAMTKFRERYMYYSYCYDTVRYPVPPPECVIVPSERHLFKETGRLKRTMRMKFGRHPTRHRSSRQRLRRPAPPEASADDM